MQPIQLEKMQTEEYSPSFIKSCNNSMNFFVVIILEKDNCALKSLSAYWKPLFV